MKNTKISELTQLLVDTENTGGHPVLLGPEVRQNTGIALSITNVDKKDPSSKMPIAQLPFPTKAQCLKITEKVSFNIASEASYVYILSAQKLIKHAKNGPFWRVFENLKLAVKQCYQTCHFFNSI